MAKRSQSWGLKRYGEKKEVREANMRERLGHRRRRGVWKRKLYVR